MASHPIDVRAIGQAGAAALQAGDAGTARQHFERLVALGHADASVWVALAVAYQALKDEAQTLVALDKALALEPRNLRALIMKGDCLAAKGNARGAVSFYDVVLALTAQSADVPPAVTQALPRIKTARNRIHADFELHLRKRLGAFGYDERRSSARFAQSLDMLTGKKQRYVQEPRQYFFPELPNIQFYPRNMFPWLDAVEAATEDICAELSEISKEDFVPYIQTPTERPIDSEHKLLNSLDWSAFFIWKDGAPVAENARRCPKTLAALEPVPLARISERTPSILFSRLKPGARIAPHTGFLNTRLICHLPLVVPLGCHFRVGNDQRQWEKGKGWVFDDTIEHEAWNSSGEPRVVLIFDIWRPELSDEERSLVAALIEAVDSYETGAKGSWNA
jgi:aspartyl/asparaginyl beta-hydroxylase (cupin superfamily)